MLCAVDKYSSEVKMNYRCWQIECSYMSILLHNMLFLYLNPCDVLCADLLSMQLSTGGLVKLSCLCLSLVL